MDCEEDLRARSGAAYRSGRPFLRVGDDGEQGLPIWEDDVCRDRAQMLEEA
jgi:hypothetical protein